MKVSWQSNCHYNNFCHCIECPYKEGCLYDIKRLQLMQAEGKHQDHLAEALGFLFSSHMFPQRSKHYWMTYLELYNQLLVSPMTSTKLVYQKIFFISLLKWPNKNKSVTQNTPTYKVQFQHRISLFYLILKDNGYTFKGGNSVNRPAPFWKGIYSKTEWTYSKLEWIYSKSKEFAPFGSKF